MAHSTMNKAPQDLTCGESRHRRLVPLKRFNWSNCTEQVRWSLIICVYGTGKWKPRNKENQVVKYSIFPEFICLCGLIHFVGLLYATLVAKLPVHLSIPHRLGCIQYQSGYELWLSDKSNTIDRVHYVAMWKSFHIRLLFYVYGTKIIFLHEIYMPCRLRKWLHCVILRLSIYMYTWLQKILLSSSKH